MLKKGKIKKENNNKLVVIYRRKIIGELVYADYSKVNEGDSVLVQLQVIHNKVKLNDYVKVIRYRASLFKQISNSFAEFIYGQVVSISGSKLTIATYGTDKLIKVRRNNVELVNKNDTRIICNLVENDRL